MPGAGKGRSGTEIALGLDDVEMVLLVLTLAVSLFNFSSNRSNYIQGLIHLILFGAIVVLIFD